MEIFFVALLPIVCIFLFLFVFKQTSLRAALYSYAVTLVITFLFSAYKLGFGSIIHATVKGALIALIAAYVLFFGIFLFHMINHVGGISFIANYLSKATNDRVLQVIVIVCGLSPLIESTSGFGIAFMMTAPIFIALGFSPMKSALLGLVSLLAVPWGALSVGTVIGAELGGISLQQFGTGTALLSIPAFIYFLIVAVFIAGGFAALKRKWKELCLFACTFTLSMILFNAYVSVELAGVLGALVSIVIGFLVIAISDQSKEKPSLSQISATVEVDERLTITKVMSPYMILTFFILLSRLWPSFSEFLQTHVVIDLPAYSFSLGILYSPGFWLFITCVITLFIFRIRLEMAISLLRTTIKQWIPFAVTTTMFISISEMMTLAGMTATVANTAGAIFGASFLVIAPFVGAIGGFLTGSGTGSNAMFIKLQMETAQQVGLSSDLVGFTQNAGSSHATMASPSRVMLGASLCGIQSEENRLLKNISYIALGAVLLVVCATICMYVLT